MHAARQKLSELHRVTGIARNLWQRMIGAFEWAHNRGRHGLPAFGTTV
jgi:hypothetical protein